MIQYIIRRLLYGAAVFLILTYLVWLFLTHEGVQSIGHLGIAALIPQRYIQFLTHIIHGNFGYSIRDETPVLQAILNRTPVTLMLLIPAFLIQELLAIFLGVLSATHYGKFLDRLITSTVFILSSLPGFWFAIVFITIFSVNIQLFPFDGLNNLRLSGTIYGSPEYWQYFHTHMFQAIADIISHLLLPIIIIVLTNITYDSQLTRTAMLRVLKEDYIRAAKAHGIPNFRIIFGHALRNAILPALTNIGVELPRMVFNIAIIEFLFNIPGLGAFFISAVYTPPSALGSGDYHAPVDYSVISAYFIILGAITIFFVILLDLLFAIIDPRIRGESSSSGKISIEGQRRGRLEPKPIAHISKIAIYPSQLFVTAITGGVALLILFAQIQAKQIAPPNSVNGSWVGTIHATQQYGATNFPAYLQLTLNGQTISGKLYLCVPGSANLTLTASQSTDIALNLHLYFSNSNNSDILTFDGLAPTTQNKTLTLSGMVQGAFMFNPLSYNPANFTAKPGAQSEFTAACKAAGISG